MKLFHLFANFNYAEDLAGDYQASYETMVEAWTSWPFKLGEYINGTPCYAEWGQIWESVEDGLVLRKVRDEDGWRSPSIDELSPREQRLL